MTHLPALEVLIERVNADHPFWSDDFDTDMLKVLPMTDDDLSFLRSVTLCTHGNLTHNRLNHPSVWNCEFGTAAFFGLGRGNPRKPAGYWTNSPLVTCTGLEAFRDAWVHSYAMIVNGRMVWDANATYAQFETIMWVVRDWPSKTEADRQRAVRKAMVQVNRAIATLRSLTKLEG